MKTNTNSFVKSASHRALEPLRVAGSPRPSVISLTGKNLVTQHLYIEGVHFDPTFLTPFELGQKTMGVCLFQLATIGARPHRVQVSAGVNQSATEPFLVEVFRGIKEATAAHSVRLDIGNSVHSPTAFLLSVTAFCRAMGRLNSCRPGDWIGVTGKLGNAVAGLHCLRRFGWQAVKDYAAVVREHLRPTPPVGAALSLYSRRKVTGMAPLADGLASEVYRFCGDYGVGAWIEEKKLPVSVEAREAASLMGLNVRQWAVFGGDDFELMVSVPGKRFLSVEKGLARGGISLVCVGEVRKHAEGIRMLNIEGETIRLANRSWNPIVRHKTR